MKTLKPKPRQRLAMLEFIVLEHPMLKGMKNGHDRQCPACRITSQSGKFFTVSIQ